MPNFPQWKVPNNPSLDFQTRVALGNLSGFLSGHQWQRYPTFNSWSEGIAEFGLVATPGDHFISLGTGVGDTGVPSYWNYMQTTGWMVWDFEEISYNPVLVGYTVGNGTQRATFMREGRHVTVTYRSLLGTTSVMGTFNSIEVPDPSNTTGLSYPLTGRFITGPASAPDYNEKGHAECVAPGGVIGECRLESSSLWRIYVWSISGAFVVPTAITAASPGVWANGHYVSGFLRYTLAN